MAFCIYGKWQRKVVLIALLAAAWRPSLPAGAEGSRPLDHGGDGIAGEVVQRRRDIFYDAKGAGRRDASKQGNISLHLDLDGTRRYALSNSHVKTPVPAVAAQGASSSRSALARMNRNSAGHASQLQQSSSMKIGSTNNDQSVDGLEAKHGKPEESESQKEEEHEKKEEEKEKKHEEKEKEKEEKKEEKEEEKDMTKEEKKEKREKEKLKKMTPAQREHYREQQLMKEQEKEPQKDLDEVKDRACGSLVPSLLYVALFTFPALLMWN
eukprot:TRINITY_DN907_c7_g1_i1.p1 TRINITY_DN907_c7_g1~~TRINITY_DN907_c7_g1_i1.p1  ORF type:complete len:267 (+),score=70.48 TRINITY_DN907_c7_g1_i1:102-902(+)